jgi:uncharacterized protein
MSGSQSHPGNGQPEPGSDPSMEDILASIRRILSEEDVPADNAAAAESGPSHDVLILDRSMLVPDASPRHEAPESHVEEETAPLTAEARSFGHRPMTEPPHEVVEEEPLAAVDAESSAPWDPPEVHHEVPPAEHAGEHFAAHAEPEPAPPEHFHIPDLPPPHEPAELPLAIPTDMTPHSEGNSMSASLPSSSGLASPETTAAAAGSLSNLVRAMTSERSTQVYSGGPTVTDLVREELRPMLKDWLDTNLPPLVERLVRAEIERVISRAAV